MSRLMLLPLAALAAIVAGCGGGGGTGEGKSEATGEVVGTDAKVSFAAAAAKPNGKRIKVVGSQFGRVVADGRGEALYLFDKEGGPKSKCYGDCAAAWPPVLTKGRPSAGPGAKSRLLGTIRRANGKRQVTYAGHPLYYYVHDAPGTILCHDVFEFGGTWLVLGPRGAAVG